MSITLDIFCYAVPLTMMLTAVLSVVTGIGGSGWTNPAKAVLMDIAFWQFSNNSPNYVSMSDAMTFLIIIHFTCTGPVYRGIGFITMFDFGPRKNIHLFCFVPPFLICRMHPNICGESFRFFCILLLRLDVSCCNLRSEWSALQFQLLVLFELPPVSLVTLTLWSLLLLYNTGILNNFLESFLIIFIQFFSWCSLWQHLTVFSHMGCVQGYDKSCGILRFLC